MNKELAKLLQGKTDPMEIAKIVSAYTKRTARKRNVAEERREWLHGVINHARKLSPEQMAALVWEFAMSSGGFVGWLGDKHPELFRPAVHKDVADAAGDDNVI